MSITFTDKLLTMNDVMELCGGELDIDYLHDNLTDSQYKKIYMKKDNDVMGFCIYGKYPEDEKYLYIRVICAKKGYGKYILKHMINLSIDESFKGIILESIKPSENFYKKYGFVENMDKKSNIFTKIYNKYIKKYFSDTVTMVLHPDKKLNIFEFGKRKSKKKKSKRNSRRKSKKKTKRKSRRKSRH